MSLWDKDRLRLSLHHSEWKHTGFPHHRFHTVFKKSTKVAYQKSNFCSVNDQGWTFKQRMDVMDVYLVSEPEVLLVFALVPFSPGTPFDTFCMFWMRVTHLICFSWCLQCARWCVSVQYHFYSCLILCNDVAGKPEWCCCSVRWECFQWFVHHSQKWQFTDSCTAASGILFIPTWLILILIQIWNCFQFLMDFIVIDLHMTESPCGLTWQRPPWWRSHFHFLLHIKGHFQQIRRSELISFLEIMNKYGHFDWNK